MLNEPQRTKTNRWLNQDHTFMTRINNKEHYLRRTTNRSFSLLTHLCKRLRLWWRFHIINWNYQPRLVEARAKRSGKTYLELEEEYWYEIACLLEERRLLRLRSGKW
ncbi:MAG: hypothetical protein D6704_06305 [Nitrospirae bacterium]|nr:MAG: hypothetical protein D6704_06305 [Nitrospirota bacterium]